MTLIDRYPPEVTGLTVGWANLHPSAQQWVDLEWLYVDRQFLDPEKLLTLSTGGNWPKVAIIEHGGKFYIHDGRHRCWLAWILGRRWMLADVQRCE